MKTEKYFEIVESVLKKFPSEYSKNYYANKANLTITVEEPVDKMIGGYYIHDLNYIIIYNQECLPHELFHMSFRDENKIGKRVWDDVDLYYVNGVSYKYKNKVCHKCLTEGFAEYLSRKCGVIEGQHFSYFFVDLLISIYGEDILKYPLLNNPGDFFGDERFFDIFEFSFNLDKVEIYKEKLVSYLNFLNDNETRIKGLEKEKMIENINKIKNNCVISIISLFNCIIDEYKNCNSPNIEKEKFIKKLESFFDNIDENFNTNSMIAIKRNLEKKISEIKEDTIYYKK